MIFVPTVVSFLRQSPSNDISASFQSGADGSITLNTLDVDPASGLTELPTDLSDRANQIVAGCSVETATDGQGEFVITGAGGLPPSSRDTLTDDRFNIPWVSEDGTPISIGTPYPTQDRSDRLVEAQGLVLDADGNAHFVESTAMATTQDTSLPSPACAKAMLSPSSD